MKEAFTITLLFAQVMLAQTALPDGDLQLDAEAHEALVNRISQALSDHYVFPETATRIVASIRDHQERRDYNSITSPALFAEKLTADLQEASGDKHIQVRFSPPLPAKAQGAPGDQERIRTNLIKTNFGFERVERLPGNIGYLDLREFAPVEIGGDTAAAAMNFLASTDALIIDLRRNMGGSPAMVALLASYLFDDTPVHLNDIHWRDGNRTQEWWTHPSVAGKRYGSKKELYVLTSHQTFSAAEEFAFDLQALKRATIIGEVTGGGANPGNSLRLTDQFSIFVPTGFARNPSTGANWERTGVRPDMAASSEKALKVGHLAAMKKVADAAGEGQFRDAVLRQIEKLRNELNSPH